jgi:hypothetical protein
MTLRRIRSVEIPPEEQGILASFLRLSDPALEGLEQALSHVTPTLDKDKLVSQLQSEPALADVADLADIVESLINIAGTSYAAEIGADEVLDVVIATIKDGGLVQLNDRDAEILKARLARLVGSKPLDLVAKASELLRANDRTFRSVRIVTDLRPVCLGDEASVAGGVIVHQFAINTSHNGRSETTYIVLDSIDLEVFNKVILRAKKKDKALREYARASSTPILSPSE